MAMDAKVRTVVTFESTAFNMAEPKNYFTNPCCFGDDLAKWLIDELRKQGSGTDDEPGQEDFGWYLNFETAGVAHTFVIGHRPTGESEAGTWFGVIEQNCGFFWFYIWQTETWNSAFGGRCHSRNPIHISADSRRAVALQTRFRQRNVIAAN